MKTDTLSVISENIRHQDVIFFANATVFITITGGLLAFLFATEPTRVASVKLPLLIGGTISSFVFWLSAEIYLYRSRAFFKRAAALDPEGFGQLLEGQRDFRPGAWGWRLLFGGVSGFWIKKLLDELAKSSDRTSLIIAIVAPILFLLAVRLGSLSPKTAANRQGF